MAVPLRSNSSANVWAQKAISRARFVPSRSAAASRRGSHSCGMRTGIGVVATHFVYQPAKRPAKKILLTLYIVDIRFAHELSHDANSGATGCSDKTPSGARGEASGFNDQRGHSIFDCEPAASN